MDTTTVAPAVVAPATTPTVMSDANIRDTVIPTTIARANTMLGPAGAQITPVAPNPISGSNTNTNPVSTAPGTSTTPNLDPSSPTYFDDLYKSLSGNIGNDPETSNELSLIDNMKTQGDTTANGAIGNIQASYDARKQALTDSQNTQTANVSQALLLGGGSRYAPVSSSGILSAKEKYDMGNLNDLQVQENQAMSEASKARDDRDYELLGKKLDILDNIRTQKSDLTKTINNSMLTENNSIRARTLQSTRDAAVANAVAAGTTNPADLLKELNSDPKSPGNYTAAEIAAALKNMSPAGDISKLDPSLRDFYTLQGQGKLPGSISSLPPDEQLFAFLHQLKTSEKVTSATGGGTKITPATAKTLNLPISTIGMTQDEIKQSLYNATVPAWFTEKIKQEGGDENTATSTWDQYREAITKNFEVPKKGAPATNASSSPSLY